MEDGPSGFRRDFTCPALLRYSTRRVRFRIRGCHSLWPDFPDRSAIYLRIDYRIDYAWNLLTGSRDDGGYGLDGERLWMTIWEENRVSFDHWTRVIGVPAERVQKLPFEEISWSTGQPGPAGSCCEIHYDRGPAYGPDGGPEADAQSDRFCPPLLSRR